MAWLTVRVGSRERAHEIDEDVLFIGSAEDAAVRIKGQGIAEKHCQILRTQAGFKVIDLGGEAGVEVNGQKVSQHDLQDGDVLVLGSFQVEFQDEAAAAAPAPAPAPAPVRGGGGRGSVPSTSRAGSRRAAKAAARNAVRNRPAERPGGQPLVRRRLRESRGLPAPALYALIAASVIATASLVFWAMTRSKVNIEGVMIEFQAAVTAGNTELAAQRITQARSMIDESHPLWDLVDEKYNDYANLKKNISSMQENEAEQAVFLSNVKPFYERYIDVKPSEDDFEKYEQYMDDPTTARYFVEYRLDPYLERWPEGPNAAQVRAWKSQLEARYNKSDPFPAKWWDVEVISAMEEKLEHYGASYKALTDFQRTNPDDKYKDEVADKLAMNLERGTSFWENYCVAAKLQPALEQKTPNYSGAWRWVLKGWSNLKGIPELEAKIRRKAQEVHDLAAAENFIIPLEELR